MGRKVCIVGIVVVAAVIWVWLGVNKSSNTGNKPNVTDTQDALDEREPNLQVSTDADDGGSGTDNLSPAEGIKLFEYSEENLSSPVRLLLGIGGINRNYNSMSDVVSSLSKDLSVDDVEALRDLLTWPNEQFPEAMRPIEINAVKNNVLDRLLRQNELPDQIGFQLVDMASNPDNDPVWRDYCIQFMTPFYEQASRYLGDMESAENMQAMQELDAIRETMFTALDEREGTLAGTSLIGLELLSRNREEFDRSSIVEKASEIAADESASAVSRMTALRMSSLTGPDKSTADTARSLAQTGETVQLRSAAIVTLGETGSEDDRELLESFTASENRQIAGAATLALEKLDAVN